MARITRLVLAAFVAGALAVAIATPALAAATISFPDTVTYGDDPDLIVTGLTPDASYLFTLYEPNAGSIQTFDFQAGPDGTYKDDIAPQPDIHPGTALFEVTTPDGKVVARKVVTVVGVSPYFRPSRLGG